MYTICGSDFKEITNSGVITEECREGNDNALLFRFTVTENNSYDICGFRGSDDDVGFQVVMLCGLPCRYLYFRDTCCLYFQY